MQNWSSPNREWYAEGLDSGSTLSIDWRGCSDIEVGGDLTCLGILTILLC